MRWLAMLLAVVSGLLLVLAVGAGSLGALSRGGESLLSLGGTALRCSLASATLATALGLIALVRLRKTGKLAVAVLSFAMGIVALLASGVAFGILAFLEHDITAKAEEETAATKRHETPLSAAARAGAHPITWEALQKEWAADHDACDAHHKNEVLAIEWQSGGMEWVDRATCSFLLYHGDMVCCLAAGAVAPPTDLITLVGRYGGTDRRYTTRTPEAGKLVLEGCQMK